MKSSVKIGMIGFGTVATGAVQVLQSHAGTIRRRLGASLDLVKVADLDLARDRGVKLSKGVLTSNVREVLDDPEIDVVVELIGGYDPARMYILEAISKKKHVVTANKALLAVHGEEIFRAAEEHGVTLGFEGSVGGGIPIVRAIKEGLAAEELTGIYGIVNGTSNYILTRMSEEGKGFDEVLAEAKRLGYAEADPTLDIEGVDSAHKLAILTTLSFGTPVDLKEIYTEGISRITPLDISYAQGFGYKLKLLAIAKADGDGIEARVHPTMIPKEYLLAKVGGVFNAIYLIGKAVGETLFYGRGAGSLPTGSAVVSDVVEIARGILAGAGHRLPPMSYMADARPHLRVKPMEDLESLYYLRFMAEDRPGVLSKISGVLGENRISISSVVQKGRKEGGTVPVVMMTHKSKERDIRQALGKIDKMPYVSEPTVFIRVEGEER
ncbi:MAG TPA: homoserine dehydrogenase [Nitrospiria bacterium]|nr:homoserine dehydrogenase [Nitrospiria bacterium]